METSKKFCCRMIIGPFLRLRRAQIFRFKVNTPHFDRRFHCPKAHLSDEFEHIHLTHNLLELFDFNHCCLLPLFDDIRFGNEQLRQNT